MSLCIKQDTYLLFVLLDLFLHDDLLVVNGQVDGGDTSSGQSFDLMAQKGLVGEFNQGFGHGQS